ELGANTVEVNAPGFDPAALRRSFFTSSSCGVCGKGALEAVAVEAPRVDSRLRLGPDLLEGLPDRLRAEQGGFAATGGLHATGLFDAGGELRCLREDVGRHNAMDKVVGWAFLAGLLPLRESVLCGRGRLSFALVQKAAVAGCPILVAVGAPSSLAVDLARDRTITLCGFVRAGRMNVYTEAWRVETRRGSFSSAGRRGASGGPKARARSRGRRRASGPGAVSAGRGEGGAPPASLPSGPL